ncbi:aminopeptidase P N-terminal domain-containing protein [Sulfurirhabdus autotrophica]|uniref:Xaa-Pro aminopeptidase n=1 Tax=Sulfurirhabdus autotrophica TaxID=1706046 RepID=A0A4R3XZW1_9PROT|nr:aminopeptidase P N-terminal domain-containing protein [Sulfurirhabdus autotrophica]TCV84692.1 aminopeptidase P [Sulfurirhabdus autotrophica]
MTDIKRYQERRHHLSDLMGQGIAIIPTAPERLRNRDSHYPYRFDSYFYYLTGFAEPESVLVLVAGDIPKSILFCRDKDMEREIWDGFRYGPEAAREAFGFDETYSISKLDELVPKLLADQPTMFYGIGVDSHWDERMVAWLNRVREQSRSGVVAPSEIRDIRVPLDEMRLIKRPEEIHLMRRAAEISTGAHSRAMLATRPGRNEYEIEAELMHEFRRHGAESPAYTSIVAGGANACVLHYIANNAPLNSGDLLLIDAGCEMGGYAADITRTFPVSGKFSPAQKDLYEMVLASQAAAIAVSVSGHTWDEPHQAAVKVLAQGMIDFGLCKGTVDAVIESGDYKRFYMHRTGHWLGLDVHDAGEYKHEGKWRELQPGMALTVEPGCYVRPGDDVPEAFWNIGIRIEDDILVTVEGNEVLTAAAPKTVSEIESLMRHD